MFHQRFKSIDQRFAEKYEVLTNGCWHWSGKDKDYPKFWDGRGYIRANRFSLERKLGRSLLPGEHACHHCDNVRCVNPDHLFVGTHTANMQDRASKGRGNHKMGAENGRAVLQEDDVRMIREMYASGLATQDLLAGIYGVKQVTISYIVRRKTWRHIDDATLPTQGDQRTEGRA